MATLISPTGALVVVPDEVADDYVKQGFQVQGVEPEPVKRRKSKDD